jgi:3-oxoacyl-[acyl-carrier-protein] synthase-3
VIPVGIAGIGKYTPERRLSNADLERMVDTSDEWIVQRTGIRQRRIAAPGELTSAMATTAARQALEDAGMSPQELDLIICCTVTGDYTFPATACIVGHNLGASQAGGFDVTAACSGFLFGLQTAAQFVATGAKKAVLVVGAEKLSAILDYTDRNTCVLFGDGAGAVVVTPFDRAGRGKYLGGSLGMEGGNDDVLCVPAGGTKNPASHATVDQRMHYMKMGGTRVFRFAVRIFAELVATSMQPYGYDQLGLIVPHQVNQRIIESAAERLDLPLDRFFINIANYGNTSAASVPIALAEAHAAGRLESGKIVCMVAFGAGLMWGHVLLRW